MKRRKIDPYPEKPTLKNPSLIRVKSLEESGLLKKGISETIKNETIEQIGRLLSMLLGILAASVLENASAGREVRRAGENF